MIYEIGVLKKVDISVWESPTFIQQKTEKLDKYLILGN